MTTRKGGLIVTSALALLLTLCTYLLNNYPETPLRINRVILDVLDVIQVPAKAAGFFMSGNVHQPNEVVTYVVLFLTYWLLAGSIIWLVGFISRGARKDAR